MSINKPFISRGKSPSVRYNKPFQANNQHEMFYDRGKFIYTYISNGREFSVHFNNMYTALSAVARDHESLGVSIPVSLSTPTRVYVQQDLLLLCKRNKLL